MKRKPAKEFLMASGAFSRKDGAVLTWKAIDRLFAAIDEAGFVYGGALSIHTTHEQEQALLSAWREELKGTRK